jgi:hypothetical protein
MPRVAKDHIEQLLQPVITGIVYVGTDPLAITAIETL